ncbi:site-specific integrase [Halorussus salinisoli]|uniref:site-specific integrase n=1 Tax=Halorussus salinisoli TaxID=2558242 RepID=UPI0010C1C98E|nr:site-specific integrase [Halorussus salinisoli]
MVRIDDSGDKTKCWLSFPGEKDEVISTARSTDWERAIAMRLMVEVGCRASGVLTASPSGVQYNSDGEFWQIEIQGKNTKGGEKTTRDAYLPDSVKQTLDIFADERDISDDEQYVDASVSTVRRWVTEAVDDIADETGNDRWRHVSSHDLRRSWASHYLVDEQVAVRVMMEIGGWSSYDAIEPYLRKPSPEVIGDEMADAELA